MYRLAQDCDYKTLKDELIRDRIVVGVLDDGLSDQLQAKEDLTLEKAVQLSRQTEARKANRPVVRGERIHEDVAYVENEKHRNVTDPTVRPRRSQQTTPMQGGGCMFCGRQKHDRAKCPARDVTVHVISAENLVIFGQCVAVHHSEQRIRCTK